MRAALLRSALVLAVLGAVVGVVVALGVRWWNVAHAPTRFGFFSYAPLPDDVNINALGIQAGPGWWAVVWPAAVTGLVVGMLVTLACAVLGRRPTLQRTS